MSGVQRIAVLSKSSGSPDAASSLHTMTRGHFDGEGRAPSSRAPSEGSLSRCSSRGSLTDSQTDWEQDHLSDEQLSDSRKQGYKTSAQLQHDYLSVFGLICYMKSLGGAEYTRYCSPLRSKHLDPRFTRDNRAIRGHPTDQEWKSFCVKQAKRRDWKNSINIADEGMIERFYGDENVRRRARELLDTMIKAESERRFASSDQTVRESTLSEQLVKFTSSIENAGKWVIHRDRKAIVASCGGAVAFPVTEKDVDKDGLPLIPAVKTEADIILTDAKGERVATGEIKRYPTPSIHRSSFFVQALHALIGHNALASVCLAGRRFAMLWCEDIDGVKEIHKFPEQDKLVELDQEDLIDYFVHYLSLVADPEEETEPVVKRKKISLSAITINTEQRSDMLPENIAPPCNQNHRDVNQDVTRCPTPEGDDLESVEDHVIDWRRSLLSDLKVRDVWEIVRIRDTAGDLIHLTRLRDDLNGFLRSLILGDY